MIFLGYPNWNVDLPMPLYTFLEQYDFSGKTIIPFTVHGGSGFSRTIQAGNYSDRNMAFRFLNGKVHIAGLERAYVFQMEIDNTHASYF